MNLFDSKLSFNFHPKDMNMHQNSSESQSYQSHITFPADHQEKSDFQQIFDEKQKDYSDRLLKSFSEEFDHNSNLIDQQNFEEHPLIAMEKEERLQIAVLENQANTSDDFLHSKSCAIKSNLEISSIMHMRLNIEPSKCYPERHDNSQNPNIIQDWGNFTCISVLPEKYVIVGTAHGIILVFDSGFTQVRKLGSKKEEGYGPVIALDISMNGEEIVCGYSNGYIALWSLTQNEKVKTIKDNETIFNVKFLSGSNHSFLASFSNGDLYLYKVEFSLFQIKVERKKISLQETKQEISEDLLAKEETRTNLIHIPFGIFSIHTIHHDYSKSIMTANPEIVALVSMKEVTVMSLGSSKKVLYRHKRPLSVSDSVVPCVNWGRGLLKGDDKTHILLGMSWGNDVYLLKVEFEEGWRTLTENFRKIERMGIIGHYYSEDIVCSLEWVCESKLVTYSHNGCVKILFTGRFDQLDSETESEKSSALITSILLKPDELQPQIFIDHEMRHRLQKSVLHYTQTLKPFNNRNKVLAIADKGLILLEHLGWQEYLESLFEKKDWSAAFSICVSLYNGENNVFSGLPEDLQARKELIKSFSFKLVVKYIQAICRLGKFAAEDLKKETIWESTITNIIDFMLLTDNSECLFSEVKRILEAMGFRNHFFKSLEDFILKKRIHDVADHVIKEIVLFCISGKTSLAQLFIMNLSLEHIDYAITLCLQNNLLTALFSICSKKEGAEGPDFLIPLGGALSRYKKSLEEKYPNQKYGIKFLWFIHMILNGRLFPEGVLNEEVWEIKVKDIIILIFEEENLDLVLHIEPYLAFEILEIFFKPTWTTIIKSWEDELIKLPDSLKSTEDGRQTDSFSLHTQIIEKFINFTSSACTKLQGKMLSLIYYCSKKHEKYDNHLYYFLAKIGVQLECGLPLDVIKESFFYILENPYQNPPWKISPQDTVKLGKEYALKNEQDIMLLGLLKRLELTNDDQMFNKIIKQAQKTDFIDLKAYLYGVNREFKKVFEIYLEQTEKRTRSKIFDWLTTNIPILRANSPNDFGTLKDLIIFRLKSLVAISSEETGKIITEIGSNLHMEVLKHLSTTPTLQLTYIKDLFVKKDYISFISDELLTLHIKLLCQICPKQVIKEIQKHDYPLDMCLKLCKEYNIKDALAFLYERTGNLMQGLEIYLELFEESLVKKINKIIDRNLFNAQTLNNKFNTILNICKSYHQHLEITNEELWLYTLDKLLEYYQKHIANRETSKDKISQSQVSKENNLFKELTDIYLNYLSCTVEDMSKTVAIEEIIRTIQTYKDLRLSDLKPSFLGTLELHYFEKNILYNIRNLIMQDNCDNLRLLHIFTAAALRINKSRVSQAEEFSRKRILVFSCGHAYGQQKEESYYCKLCIDKDFFKAQNLVNNIAKRSTFEPSSRVALERKKHLELIFYLKTKDDILGRKELSYPIFQNSSPSTMMTESFQNTRNSIHQNDYLKRLNQFEENKSFNTIEWENEKQTSKNRVFSWSFR